MTRILKCLGEFDREKDARSLLLFMLAERDAYGWSDLGWTGRSAFRSSFCGYYVWCFRTLSLRDEILRTVDGVLCGEQFGEAEYREAVGGIGGEDLGGEGRRRVR
jgi:hypothetical protein